MTRARLLSPLLLLCTLFITLAGTLPVHASGPDLLRSLGIAANTRPTFLTVSEAFKLKSQQQGNQLLLTFHIADGYYLYRHSVQLKGSNLTILEPTLPAGSEHQDDFFGKTQVYYQQVTFAVPLQEVGPHATLRVRYQGCTDGLCYPPTDQLIEVAPLAVMAPPEHAPPLSPATTSNALAIDAVPSADVAPSVDAAPSIDATLSEQDQLAAALGSQGFWLSIAAFFVLGLGLAFTPCVFP
ncbi:MAG: protein-disulfide reductase DsbD domain-containing protein, partial [Aeromonas sp.]